MLLPGDFQFFQIFIASRILTNVVAHESLNSLVVVRTQTVPVTTFISRVICIAIRIIFITICCKTLISFSLYFIVQLHYF